MTEFSLQIAGQRYGGWKTLSVSRSLRDAAAVFSVTLSERWAGRETALPIRPGSACVLDLDGEVVVSGHVDVYAPSFSGGEHNVTAEGRSKTADIVDCAAVVSGGQFKNYDAGQVARALAAPFGIAVETVGDLGAAFPDVQVQQGETCFALIERLARMRGLLVTDDASGRLLIGRLETLDTRPAVALRQGKEIIAASLRLDWSQRFSTYRVKAQRAGTDEAFGEAAAAVEAEATDPDVLRYRPWLEVAETSSDEGDALRRAKWQASTAAARATSIDVTVQGWRSEDGALWASGRRVNIEAPALSVSRDLVVDRVEFQAGENGTVTQLVAVPAAALQPEPLVETDTEESLI